MSIIPCNELSVNCIRYYICENNNDWKPENQLSPIKHNLDVKMRIYLIVSLSRDGDGFPRLIPPLYFREWISDMFCHYAVHYGGLLKCWIEVNCQKKSQLNYFRNVFIFKKITIWPKIIALRIKFLRRFILFISWLKKMLRFISIRSRKIYSADQQDCACPE